LDLWTGFASNGICSSWVSNFIDSFNLEDNKSKDKDCSISIEFIDYWIYYLWICEFYLKMHIMKETTDLTYTIVTIITVLLFALPLLYMIYRKRKQLTLNPKEIRKLFNHTLLLQILLGLFLYLTFLVFGGDIFGDLTSAKWFEVISIAIVWFYIIGLFYYIPSIVLMNLVIWLIILTRKKRQLVNLKETKNT
jgi:hypothetical protein